MSSPGTGSRDGLETNPPRFEPVYEAFHAKIHRYLQRLVGTAEAEDLTQEVFAKVDQGLPAFRGTSAVSTWIYRIATNVAIEHVRRRAPRAARETTDAQHAALDEGPGVDQTIVRGEMHDCIRGYVAGLPLAYRTVLVLSEYAELADQQIAEALGITVGTVKIRLHRARRRLKDVLGAGCALYRDDRNELACEPRPPAYLPRPHVRL
jgi:RNA polymerase sigma-70 factor (ECF subfamily)